MLSGLRGLVKSDGSRLRRAELVVLLPGCGRPVGDLYPNGVYFRCRKCCGLGYQSQLESRKARASAKAARIRQRLCGERPKGMQWRTYQRLLEQLAEADAQARWKW